MKKILFFLILIFINLSVVYIFFIKVLDKNLDLKLDPIQRKKLEHIENKAYKIVLLGDSHTALWQTKEQNCLNLGISGFTSEQIRLRSDLLLNKLIGEKLIISLGDNDVACLSTNSTRAIEVEKNVIDNLEKIVKNHNQNFKEIYCLTISPRTDWHWYERLFEYELKVKTRQNINFKIKEFAKKNNIKIIDIADFFDKNNKSEDLTIDGQHFSKKTYDYLEKELLK